MGKWTRRAFIAAGGAVGGGLVLGVGGVLFAPRRLGILPESEGEHPGLTTWIEITPDGRVIAVVPHCEMGQGAVAGLAMMLAEELEADWDRVEIREAPAEDAFANGYILRGFALEAGIDVPRWLERVVDFASFKAADLAGLQLTGGSTSTRATGQYGMRVAGAAGKAMLLEAASRGWGVPVEELRARDSRIVHAGSGREAGYGDLASLASTMKIPTHPPLKSREQYRIVGTFRPRPDIPSKVTGTARYGIDVVVPDMVYAAILKAPVPGGQLTGVDDRPALEMPGVRTVVRLADAVAVVADGYWRASQALRALRPEFTDAGRGSKDTAGIYAEHSAALDADDPRAATRSEAAGFTAEYRVPYLAHATMEPMCATARVANGTCEVWAGTQDPIAARRTAASASGLDVENVMLNNFHLGGGFGRRLPGNFDYIEQAVRVASAVSPLAVKLIWSREEDMRHDYYRPLVVARFRGETDARGRPLSWTSRFTGGGLDSMAARPLYEIKDVELRAIDAPVHLRTGAWRSVASSQHGFFTESFIDELAHEAGADPLEYRSGLLSEKPRHQAVLARAAQMAGWTSPPPEGRARGVAIVESFGSIVAEIAEVGLDDSGRIRVHRVDAAVDCGLVVNPDQARAQIEGGIIFGLSAALFQEITVRNGAVEQASFPDFEMIRLSNAPRVNVEFIQSDAHMGGMGEPGVPPIAPAVANAVFALTGTRLRSLPLRMAPTPTA